ncbi:MAG: glycosyltransferase [Luteitalea sp.]|nr:glycosyltransferase [Luteitalea sp.]
MSITSHDRRCVLNVLVLGCLTDATGNAVTAPRIARHLEPEHRVVLADARAFRSPSELHTLVRHERIDAAIGLHALLAGPLMLAADVPYALVFGGTDLYEPVHNLHMRQMSQAVASAECLVAFSPENQARAESLWPSAVGRVRCIPQAVEVEVDEGYSLRRTLGLADDDVLLLLPAGLRQVKDPLHLIEAVVAWHRTDRRVHLVLVGAALEPWYADHVLGRVATSAGVHYVPSLPRARFLAAVCEAAVVLNTSLGEGMCGVILEAMQLGTPVVARRNPGNAAIISHGRTGLLYETPQDFVRQTNSLLANKPYRERIGEAARRYVDAVHAMAPERRAYLTLVRDLCPGVSRSRTSDSESLITACPPRPC